MRASLARPRAAGWGRGWRRSGCGPSAAGEPGGADASGAVVDEHDVVFDGKKVRTKIYDRARLEPGAEIAGPAIVTEFDSTTVVLPAYEAKVDTNYNILINPSA